MHTDLRPYPRCVTKGFEPFDPLWLARETERLVCRGDARQYTSFYCPGVYGGISTGYTIGCCLRCIFCQWISPATSPRSMVTSTLLVSPESSDKPSVVIYTDGACAGNPGTGGWAAILRYDQEEKVLCGGASDTTNNRMELRAAIEALRALGRPHVVHLHTDSEYLRLGISEWLHRWQHNGWRTRGQTRVRNRDLWQALLAAQESHDVQWHWVKGHADDPDNVRADLLAQAALEEIGRRAPPDHEPLDEQLALPLDCGLGTGT